MTDKDVDDTIRTHKHRSVIDVMLEIMFREVYEEDLRKDKESANKDETQDH